MLFVGGRLCLDFFNSANWSLEGHVLDEKLETLEDLAEWCRGVAAFGSLEAIPASRFRAGELEALKRFRLQLRRLFLAVLSEAVPRRADLAALNAVLQRPYPAQTLRLGKAGFALQKAVCLDQIVAQSALALLTHHRDLDRVKVCPGDHCAWLFLDDSRTGRRRWCAMETCGNRAKARRHYERVTGRRV
ncbi:MAG: CGNR zinc finger domain-containing protein [Pseudomonadota bacterium]